MNERDAGGTVSLSLGTDGVRYDCFFFFFQAEDGIRDLTVTGVQTCALPIWLDCGQGGSDSRLRAEALPKQGNRYDAKSFPVGVADYSSGVGEFHRKVHVKIGRASCRERV